MSSPVLVLPTSNESTNALVANLGKITISNSLNRNLQMHTLDAQKNHEKQLNIKKFYFIEVRNINLFSLNIMKCKDIIKNVSPAKDVTSYDGDAVAILHNTAIHLQCVSESQRIKTNSGWKSHRIILVYMITKI